ncbi:hypothetical protein [Escherichia phage vB_EcoS_ULIM2]|nr:hypothetical protein [Escherichia phage vB_EcoS_ULIM2]
MITINLSDKQAREILDTIGDQLHIKGATSELLNQIERQLTPTSTNQSEFAAWKSERTLPNIIKAWKRKHKKEINVEDKLTEVLNNFTQYQIAYMERVTGFHLISGDK